MLNRILDPCGIIRVQSWDIAASTPPALDQVVGTAWPRDVGTVSSGFVDVLCVGPTDWLLIDATSNAGSLCERLRTALAETSLRPTDVSHSQTRVLIEGPDAHELLLESGSLDLHPGRFPVGRCARTRFAGVPTVLRRHDSSRFEAILAASYWQYLQAWIADASLRGADAT